MNIIFFLLLFTTVIYIYKVIKNIILIKKKERTKKKQVFKELIISIMVICVTSFCMYQIYGFLEKLKQPSLSWTKKSFTQEEINSICKGLNLKQTERYHIISAKYESGKKLSIYIHIKDDAAKKTAKKLWKYGILFRRKIERLHKQNGWSGWFF